MNNGLLIIILLVILTIIIIKNKKTENFYEQDTHNTIENIELNDVKNIDNFLDKIHKKQIKKNKINVTNHLPKINSEFIENQYNLDYNDTINAINNLTPQKELFNLSFLPVRESSPPFESARNLVDFFISKLNKEVQHNVNDYVHINSGWNDMGKKPREKNGFETQMEYLGLPSSLYPEPAQKEQVELININKAIQYNTENQIRFIIDIIIQKPHVKDQMVLQVLFFMEKEDDKIGDRSSFFDKQLDEQNNDIEQKIIIEQIFITGYLTDNKKISKANNFHTYDNKIKHKDGSMNQEQIIKSMLRKHKEREKEWSSFLMTTDKETQDLHNFDKNEYDKFKNTRTIMDDLSKFPQNSFNDIHI